MKKLLNKITVSLLVVTMVLTMSVSIYATNTKQTKESPFVVKYNAADSTYNSPTKTFDLYFYIPREAATYDSIKLDLSGAMLDGLQSIRFQPGDSFSYNIIIKNQSGVDFAYKQGSYFLTDLDMEGEANKYGIKSFSNKVLDDKLVPYRISSARAIYKGLFDYFSPRVSGIEMATIDTYLANKGYTGDEALTNYLLKYYNDSYKTNAKVISELPALALADIFSTGINNATYTMSDAEYNSLTDAQKENIVKGKGNYLFRETEKQLAEYYYNYFYDWCVGVVMGKHVKKADANGKLDERLVSTSSILKVYNNVNGVRDEQDAYLTKTLTTEMMNDVNGATLLAGFLIDGPLTGNNAACYDFGFKNGIELEKVISEGDVTVSKTLDLNGYKNNDSPTFIFKLTDSKGINHYKTVSFKEGQTSQLVKFENIPLGKYVIEEIATIRYQQTGEIPSDGTLTRDNNSQTVLITNRKEKNNDFSDTNVVVNSFKKTDEGIEISQNYQGTQE